MDYDTLKDQLIFLFGMLFGVLACGILYLLFGV